MGPVPVNRIPAFIAHLLMLSGFVGVPGKLFSNGQAAHQLAEAGIVVMTDPIRSWSDAWEK